MWPSGGVGSVINTRSDQAKSYLRGQKIKFLDKTRVVTLQGEHCGNTDL